MTLPSAGTANRPGNDGVTNTRVRGPRRGSTPTISVVIASNRERHLLQACLASLTDQCARMRAEIVVARAATPPDAATLSKVYPGISFLDAPADASIPELRALGMASATGDIVALTEDHCVADERWLETLTQHAVDGADVVGGGMDNAQRARVVDWAAYFSEYGFFAPGRPARPEPTDRPPLLTGANVAYSRRIVGDVIEWARRGEWENVAHDRLFSRGSVLRFADTAAIYQNQTYTVPSFCRDRFEHGRDYAQKRLAEDASAPRWLLLAATPALPFVLSWRVGKAVGDSRRGAFLRALPTTVVFFAAWALGEAAGYLRGPAAPTAKP